MAVYSRKKTYYLSYIVHGYRHLWRLILLKCSEYVHPFCLLTWEQKMLTFTCKILPHKNNAMHFKLFTIPSKKNTDSWILKPKELTEKIRLKAIFETLSKHMLNAERCKSGWCWSVFLSDKFWRCPRIKTFLICLCNLFQCLTIFIVMLFIAPFYAMINSLATYWNYCRLSFFCLYLWE